LRERLLPYLACPACRSDLGLSAQDCQRDHVMTGVLTCTGCRAAYPIRDGIPRLGTAVEHLEERTAAAFGHEWTVYNHLVDHYRTQFLDWIRPVDERFFRGRAVLEGGCGKGRHTALAAEFGATDVVAIDLGVAVEPAFANTRHLPNAHVVQADLKRPPVKRVFDYAYSIGVLHHLPDPEAGFQALASCVRPGGAVSAWVYGREGNGWIVHLVSPVRTNITSRMPHGLLNAFSVVLTIPLFLVTKLVYRPATGTALGTRLPYGEYLRYISRFPYREQRLILFDHLVAPVAHYLRRDEFLTWFERAGLEHPRIAHHNGNSWRGFAYVPVGQQPASPAP